MSKQVTIQFSNLLQDTDSSVSVYWVHQGHEHLYFPSLDKDEAAPQRTTTESTLVNDTHPHPHPHPPTHTRTHTHVYCQIRWSDTKYDSSAYTWPTLCFSVQTHTDYRCMHVCMHTDVLVRSICAVLASPVFETVRPRACF